MTIASKFCVCWYDPITKEHGCEPGENNMDWAEADEVASHFRAEQNGLLYYVGDEYGDPAMPTFEEIIASMEVHQDMGWEDDPATARGRKLLQFTMRGAL